MFDKKEYRKIYDRSDKERKRCRIKDWKMALIIFHDWELLHEIYVSTTHCDYCKCLLNTSNKTRKCLDHNHDIVDNENVRGVLCFYCNTQDVLNPNKKESKIAYRNNTLGIKNIYYHKVNNIWIFSKNINKKTFYKSFKTLEDAIQFKKEYLKNNKI